MGNPHFENDQGPTCFYRADGTVQNGSNSSNSNGSCMLRDNGHLKLTAAFKSHLAVHGQLVELICDSCDANLSQCGWWIPECVSASAASEARWQSKSSYDPFERNEPPSHSEHHFAQRSTQSVSEQHSVPSSITNDDHAFERNILKPDEPFKHGVLTGPTYFECHKSWKYHCFVSQPKA
ncbi:hypothetical protein M0802_003142 [Mischocyttarus mexicanus]|nr:hypothetical protein M0802_003142 [Mischocyttarus mexicanus]